MHANFLTGGKMKNHFAKPTSLIFLIIFFACKANKIENKNDALGKILKEKENIIQKAISDDDFLKKINLQKGFYFNGDNNQFVLIKIDNSYEFDVENQKENQKEECFLYFIKYGLNSKGKVFSSESESYPVESIKKYANVKSKIKKRLEFKKDGLMIYSDKNTKSYLKYQNVSDIFQLEDEMKKIFQNKFDLYLGTYYSEKYGKHYKLSKSEKKYMLEVQDCKGNVVKDYYDFDAIAVLTGKENKYFIRIDKECDSFNITEVIDFSLYPGYSEMNPDYQIEQESVNFRLEDKIKD